jgi:hypothetical protein
MQPYIPKNLRLFICRGNEAKGVTRVMRMMPVDPLAELVLL